MVSSGQYSMIFGDTIQREKVKKEKGSHIYIDICMILLEYFRDV